MAGPVSQALLRQLRRVRLGWASGPMKPEGVSTRTLSNWAALDAGMARRDADFMWVCSLSCSLCVLGIALDEEINHIRTIKAKAAHVAQAAPSSEPRPMAC